MFAYPSFLSSVPYSFVPPPLFNYCQLNFEDGRGGLQLVNIETLHNLLRVGGLELDFVFVSACHR